MGRSKWAKDAVIRGVGNAGRSSAHSILTRSLEKRSLLRERIMGRAVLQKRDFRGKHIAAEDTIVIAKSAGEPGKN